MSIASVVPSRRRAALFASVSVVALAVASPAVLAADLPKKAPTFAPAPVPQDHWTWWVEGGAFNSSDPGFGPFPFLSSPVGIQPKLGWEGAIGFDYSPSAYTPYHFSGQFRYGEARRKGKTFPASFYSPSFPFSLPKGPTTANVAGAGSADIKEHHWLVDFAIGRDFQLGSGQAQAKLGVRVADIYAKVTGKGTLNGCDTGPGSPAAVCAGAASPITGVFSFSSRSEFLGVGPRLGIDGGIPLGGAWSLDYIGDAAVLFGKRSFDQSSTMTLNIFSGGLGTPPTGTGTVTTATSSSSTGAVFNLDGQLGISYQFNPSFKMTASYRFDGYWNALRTVNSSGAIVNENAFYYGPVLKASVSF
ncbi:MAG TPA: Lpg1974 family pore-forming outer membrane protein [Pseudolabrys sp.]|nr:Lpg1974 family pore-forming outer membrane protein [Pseudolabrys sp.]